MTIISNQELDTMLQGFLQSLKLSFYNYDYPFFKTLYDFGFRFNEMFTLHNSVINENNLVECITSKGNPYRFIPLSSFDPLVQESLIRQIDLFVYHKKDIYHNIFNDYFQLRHVFIGNHAKTIHLFRHNVAKKIFASSGSVQSVMNYLGVVKEETALIYINSKIYF